MRRTTIYLDSTVDVLLQAEARRQKRPMAEIVREAVEAYVTRDANQSPPGAGEFASGHTDTADHAEEVLAETGFGSTARSGRHPRTARKNRR